MKLTLVEKKDLPLICHMAKIIWPSTYGSILSDDQMVYMLNKLYDLAYLEGNFDQGHQFYLIEEDQTKIGFLELIPSEDQLFINKFYILPSDQKFGVGSKVIQLVQRQAAESNKVIRLQVNRKNFKAINFYFKNGFHIEQVQDFDIGEGYFMNDFIMIWKQIYD